MKPIKIILALIGLGMVAEFSLLFIGKRDWSRKTTLTSHEINQAAVALQLYDVAFNRQPDETDNTRLVAILEGDNPRKLVFIKFGRNQVSNGKLIDAWGRPITFKKTPKGLLIRSAGEDGAYDTKDDLTREVAQMKQGT